MKNTFLIILLFSFVINCKEEKKQISPVNPILSKEAIESMFFIIDCKLDTILIGEKGTKISIPHHSFINSKGEIINKNIQFELKECINKVDMVLANLHTVTNGKILESGGMVYLNATQNGEKLSIADDK